MHILTAIEQKRAFNPQILVDSCPKVDKNVYLCTQNPSCAVSKEITTTK